MRRQRRIVRLLSLVFCIGLLAAACGSSSKKSSNSNAGGSSSSSAAVPKGGTLVIGAEQEPDCTDWISSCAASSWGYWMVAVNTMPRTYDLINDNGKYSYHITSLLAGEPKLETSPKQVVTYTINDKAVWSDGQPITSTDFKYTWDQIANGTDVYDKTGYSQIESVDDSNPKVAVVTFSQPYSDWRGLFMGNYGVEPSHLLQGKDRDAIMKDGYTFSGGPWMLEGWTKTDNITLVPNPNYWGTKPNLDKVIFKFQTDTSAEFTAFKSNQVSMIYPQPQPDAIDQINAGIPGAQKIVVQPSANYELLWLNNGKAPFSDVNVRKAVAFAVDRSAIVQRLFGGLGLKDPLQFIDPPVASQYVDDQAFAKYKQDLNQANQLLTTAGYTKGSDGFYSKGGQRLSFTIRTTTGNKRRELTQQILQQQLQAVGIDMKIDNAKSGDLFGKMLPAGDFDAAIYAQSLTTLNPGRCDILCSKNTAPVGQTSGNNYTRTMIPALDDVLQKMDGTLDDSQLQTLGKQASQIEADNLVSLPIDPLPFTMLWNSKVVGPINPNGFLGPFWNMSEWGVTP